MATGREKQAGAARLGATPGQAVTVVLGTGALVLGGLHAPATTLLAVVVALQGAFVVAAIWRWTLIGFSFAPIPLASRPDEWPRYTILAALHVEAAVAPQLIRNLSRIDYPRHRLEGFLVLEAHDAATLAAIEATPRPPWLKVFIAPPGHPCTKPRALNFALAEATGDLLTIYDAEDEPHPNQLREAAARFVAEPSLGCLQAPLRIRERTHGARSTFLDRQFALEYASLFEVTLRGMARLGLPFPLGGTSNHLSMRALRDAAAGIPSTSPRTPISASACGGTAGASA